MNLLILCIATIVAKSGVLADTPVSCETDGIQNDTARLIIRLQIERIIPDLIPTIPESVLRIIWRTVEADIGNCINPLQSVTDPCYASSNIDPDVYYTQMIITPDYPSRVAALGLFLNFLTVNVRAESNVVYCTPPNGDPVAPLLPPSSGICAGSRRYCGLVFEQPDIINTTDNLPLMRLGGYSTQFNLTEFIETYNLGPLRAANYWIADDCCSVTFDSCCTCNDNNGCNNGCNDNNGCNNGCNNNNGCNSNNCC